MTPQELLAPSVADLVEARCGDCRGLPGSRMRHRPSGATFVCAGSRWSHAGRLLILARSGFAALFTGEDVVFASECERIEL
jgi:hypothetical protein